MGPNMRSREKALRQAGLSSEKGPHMSLSEAALSSVVCCWKSRYMWRATLYRPALHNSISGCDLHIGTRDGGWGMCGEGVGGRRSGGG